MAITRAHFIRTDFGMPKKPAKKPAKKKSAKKVKAVAPYVPTVPEYLTWTDRIEVMSLFMWGGERSASIAKTEKDAYAAAQEAVKKDDKVRLVGVYKLIGRVRPDRSPVTTYIEPVTS